MNPPLYDSLPPIRDGDIAALVEIVSESTRLTDTVIEARIISMLHGTYAGSRMVILRIVGTSCDVNQTRNAKGIVAGRMIANAKEALVIETPRVRPDTSLDIHITPIPHEP